jgi:hypothetical protein
VVRDLNGQNRLAYPSGKVLDQTAGWISHPDSPRTESTLPSSVTRNAGTMLAAGCTKCAIFWRKARGDQRDVSAAGTASELPSHPLTKSSLPLRRRWL